MGFLSLITLESLLGKSGGQSLGAIVTKSVASVTYSATINNYVPLLNQSVVTFITNAPNYLQNGLFVVSSSFTDFGFQFFNYQAFAFSAANSNYWACNSHSSTTTVDGTSKTGEWLQIKIPVLLNMTSFTTCNVFNSPSSILIAGSTDGITWTTVYNIASTGLSSTNSATTFGVPVIYYLSGNSNFYNYFRFIVTTPGGQTNLAKVNFSGIIPSDSTIITGTTLVNNVTYNVYAFQPNLLQSINNSVAAYSLNYTLTSSTFPVYVMAVGGGGGGGSIGGGGGGAGGVVMKAITLPAGSNVININIGAGGCGAKVNNYPLSATLVDEYYTTPVLNQISSAAYNSSQGAYGCILLNSNYTGPILQLRSPSDTTGTSLTNFYSDIYGNLTTGTGGSGTAVTAWSSNASYAYVATWYDQSNVTTNNATQTVVGSQPVLDIANKMINFGYSGGSSGGTFSVASIPGLILWLDAADPNNNGTQPANNAIVTSWKDKSGLGNNGSASSGVTYTTAGLNSKPAMYYNNGNQGSISYYFSGNVTNNNPTMSVFAVISMSSASLPSARIIGFSGGSTVNDYQSTNYFGFLRQSGTGMGPYRAGTYVSNNTYTSYSTPYVYGAWFDGTNEYTNVQVGNNTTIGSAASSGNFAITYYSIGNNPQPDSNGPFTGYISEIIVYNTSLTTTQRQQIEGYLSWKWGLQTNLPTAHPYYSASPSGSGGSVANTGYITNYNANAFLNLPNSALPYNNTSYTYVLKHFNTKSKINWATFVGGGSSPANNGFALEYGQNTGSNLYDTEWYTTQSSNVGTVAPNNVVSSTYSSGVSGAIYINGTQTTWNVTARQQVNTGNMIGGWSAGGNGYCNSQMYFLCVFNTSLNNLDRQIVEATVPTTNYNTLVSYFKLNEAAAATTVVDSISGFNGTSQNSVVFGNVGIIGNSASFNGTNQWISVPYQVLNNLTFGTIMCWIYPKAIANSTICAKQRDGQNTIAALMIGSYSNTSGALTTGSPGIVYFHSTNSQVVASSVSAVPINSWSHIAVTFNATQVNIYINGSLNSTTATNGSIPTETASTSCAIGAWYASSSIVSAFTGFIDDFSVWRSALSDITIYKVYSSQFSSIPNSGTNTTVSFNATPASNITAFGGGAGGIGVAQFYPKSGGSGGGIGNFDGSGGINYTTYTGNFSNCILYFPFDQDVLNYSSGTGVSVGSIIGTGCQITNSFLTVGSGCLQSANVNSLTSYFKITTIAANLNGYTFSCWLYISSATVGMVWSFSQNSSVGNRIYLYYNGTQLCIGTASGNVVFFTPTLYTWYHFAWTLDKSNNSLVYINGSSVFSTSSYAYLSYVFDKNYILSDPYGSGNPGMYGYIDDFYYFDTVMTPANILFIYNTSSQNMINSANIGGSHSAGGYGAGGGGAGSAGTSSTSATSVPNGGNGIQLSLAPISAFSPFGTNYGTYYWGGGGGGGSQGNQSGGSSLNGGGGGFGGGGGGATAYSTNTYPGGSGGGNSISVGNAGNYNDGSAGNGGANTGGGGGGAWNGTGGNGGSGIAVIAVPVSISTFVPGVFQAGSSTIIPLDTYSFSYTGYDQTLTVPANTSYMTVQVWGAGGGIAGIGGVTTYRWGGGGSGGYTSASLNVTAGQTLKIIVGKGGIYGCVRFCVPNTYGGGGGAYQANNDTNWGTASGGGRTAVQLLVSGSYTELITAGGGGAGGETQWNDSSAQHCAGGAGGGTTGGNGYSDNGESGSGGTQSNGGAVAATIQAGSALSGSQYTGGYGTQYGGGGGGGWYGGGGGGAWNGHGWLMGGGGGGSSYVNTAYQYSGSTNIITQGVQGTYNSLPAVANNSGLPTFVQGMIGYGGKATGQTGNSVEFYGGDGYALVTFYGLATAGTITALSGISITNFQLNDTTGSATTNGNVYTAYVLKSTGITYTINYTSAVATTIYLFAVGGGGGAGQGGGGAGGVFSDGIPVVAGTGTITITIGAGGAGVSGSNYSGVASAGGNTTVTFSGTAASKTVTAWGGGYGTNWGATGGTGGSGGGGEPLAGGAANNTGNIIGWRGGMMGSDYNGGGGGGAGGPGGFGGWGSAFVNTGFGGIGIRCLLPGLVNYQLNSQNVSYWYWAGGGAGTGANSFPGGNGGLGGGGGGSTSVTTYSGGLGGGQAINSGTNGDNSDNPGSAGANTGGGGGGSRNKVGGSGGSGIVMIALPTSIASFSSSVQKLTLTSTNYKDTTDHPYSNMVIINYQAADLVGTSTANGITYMICAFTTPNVAYTINYSCNESMPIQILAVGGGGAGSNWTGGGGGGGGVVMQYVTLPNGSNSMNISVGAGGAGPTASNTLGNNGSNSTVIFNAQSASNITAYGGGRGAGGGSTVAALTGGSGGGSSIYNIGTGVAAAGNTASNNLANSGGTGVSVDGGTGIAGGGGGAGAAAISKTGGNGIKCSMPGINAFSPYGVLYGSYFWAGGGGGCTASTNVNEGNGGAGGKGGGGGGNVAAITGKVIYGGLGDTNGINAGTNASNIDNGSAGNGGANTGGGGGGGWSPSTGTGGSGGSGIVIIAFPNSFSVDWKPTNNPGLSLWFDASDNSSIVQTGGKVSQWNDKSPNQYSIIQPNLGNRPTYVLNSLDTKPGVQLSNTSWLYQYGNAVSNYSGSLYSTAYIVIKNSAGLPSGGWNVLNTLWFNGTNLGVSRYHLSLAQGATNNVTLYADYVNNGTSGYVGQVGTVPSNGYAIIGFTVSPNATTISLNGTVTTFGGLTLLNANYGNTMFNLGDFRQALFQTSNEIIYEFVGYNIPLSTSQSQAVEGYLAWKWNLQANLPSSHPYFNIFPSQTAWTPSLVSSTMLLWLDASDRTTVITSGSNVTQWSDKSGAGNHMTQGVAANQPILCTSVLNGLNVINFGVSSFMQNTGIAVPRAYTIFGVGYTNASYTVSIYNVFTRMVSSIVDTVLFFGAFGNINADFTGSTTWNDAAYNYPYVNVDSWSIKGMTNTGAGTGQTSYVNGTPQIAKTGNNVATTGLYLGCFNNVQFWNGPMAEILIYNGVLSTNDRQAVEGYLAWKWGLQSFLPSGHPYQFLAINSASTLSNTITGTGSSTFPTTNLMFDFYAGNGCNVNTNGGALTIWNDQMKNIVATGNATFNRSVQNGLPMISGGVITTTSFGSGTMYNWTHFLVYNTGVTGNTTGELFIQNTVTNGIQTGISAGGFYTAMFKNNGNAAISSNVTMVPNKTYILTISYSLSGTIEKYTYRTNGVNTTPIVNSATAAYNYVNGSYIVTKSTTSGAAPSATGGYIGEQILYNATLSATNIQSIETHLAWKWGVSIGGADFTNTITTTVQSTMPTANLLFDFYAGSGSNVVTNGGTVTSWTDSINGVVATGSGTFNTSLQNGLPMISSGALTTPSIGSGNIDNWTHFVVCKFGSSLSSTGSEAFFENNANYGVQIGFGGSAGSGYSACYNHIAWASINSTATFVANGVYILVISYALSGTTGTYVYRTNGVDTTQSPGYTTTSYHYVTGSYIVSKGSFGGGTPQANGGYVGEQLFYNTTLSLAQMQSIEQYLSWKWSIPIGSPAATITSSPFSGSSSTTIVPKLTVPTSSPFSTAITTTLGQNIITNTFSLYVSNSAYLTVTTLANGSNDLTVYGMSIGTIEVWVNFSQSTTWAGVVVKANYYGLFISGNKFAVYSWSTQGNTAITAAGNTLNDGAWHHLAFSFSHGVSNGSFMYVDGVLVGTLTWYGNNATTNVFCLGSESSNLNPFIGYVDELRVWNFQLPTASINANYNKKVVPSVQGLVGYFVFDTDTYTIGSISAGTTFSNIANPTITSLTAYGTGLSLSTTINSSLSNYYKIIAPSTSSTTKYGLPIGLTSNLVAFIDFSNTNSYSGSGTTFYNLVDKSAQQVLGGQNISFSNGLLSVNTSGSTTYLLLANYSIKTISIWLKLNSSSNGYILDARTIMPTGWLWSGGIGSNWIKSYKNGGSLVTNPGTTDLFDYSTNLYNITIVADGVYTEQLVVGARYTFGEGQNCSIAKILIFNTELSQADNATLYSTISSASFNSNTGSGSGSVSTNVSSNMYPSSLGCIFRIKSFTSTVPITDVDNIFTLNNTGTVTCVPDPLNVRGGYVFQFSGSNYLSISVNTPAISTKTFWVYTTTPSAGQGNVFSSTNYPVNFKTTNYLSALPNFLTVANNNPSSVSQPASWTFYAVTCTASSVNIYMNGSSVQVATNSLTNFVGDTTDIQFGAYTASGYYTGYLDDVRLYPTVLTPAQMYAIYIGDVSVLNNISTNAYTSANCIYGTHLLNANYTGPVLQLRLPTDTTGVGATDFFADIYGNLNTDPNNMGISLNTWATSSSFLNNDSSLLMYYPFNSNLYNIVSGSADATFVNGGYISNNDYKVGYGSCQFVGYQQYVNSTASFTTGSNGISFSFWFRSNNSPTYARLFNFSSSYRNNTIFMGISNANQLGCSVFSGGSSGDVWNPGTTTVNDNVWRHCLWTINNSASNNSTIYLNGVASATFTVNYPQSVARSVNYFGYNEYSNGLFNGAIDDFRVYNRAINPTTTYIQEVSLLYNYNSYKYAYVTKWYDQSNQQANTAYQTTVGYQPIYDIENNVLNYGYSGSTGFGLGYLGNYNLNAYLNLPNNALPINDSSYTYTTRLLNSNNTSNAVIVSGGNSATAAAIHMLYNYPYYNQDWYANGNLGLLPVAAYNNIPVTYRYLSTGNTGTNYLYVTANNTTTSVLPAIARSQNNANNSIGTNIVSGWGSQYWTSLNSQMYYLYALSLNMADSDRYILENTVNPNPVNTPYLLNNMSNSGYNSCQGAYACLLVNNLYKGPVMQLRSPSDTAGTNLVDFYSDIYGNLTTLSNGQGIAVAAWSSNINYAFVVKWYDQSNVTTNHATQTTTSSQPVYDIANRIVNFGYTGGSGGYVANYNSNAYFNLPNGTVPYGDSSYTFVLKHWNVNTNGGYGFINGGVVGTVGTGVGSGLCIRTNNTSYLPYWGYSNFSAGTVAPNNVITTTYVSGSSRQPFYVNSTLISTGTMTSPRNNSATSNFLGVTNSASAGAVGNEYLNGQMYYMCIFNSTISNSDRNLIENIGYFPTNPNKMSVSVNNYNFAYPVQTANLSTSYYSAIPGWKTGGSAGFIVANGSAFAFTTNANFTQFFIIQMPTNAYISQNMYLNAGTTYVLTFYGSSRPTAFTTNITLSVTLNGYQIFTQTFTSGTNTWTIYTSNQFIMNYNGYYNLAFNFNVAGSGDTSVGISNIAINATNVPKVTTATATTTSSALTVTVSGTNLAFFQWKNNTTNTTNFVTCSSNSGSFTDNTSIAGGTGYTYTITPLNSISITGTNFTTSTFTTLSAYYNGLVYTIYNSYKNNDTSASGWVVYDRGNLYNGGVATGRTSNLTNIGWGTNGAMIGNWGGNSYWNGIAFNGDRHDFTIVWYGFFYTQSYGGNWTFGCNSDDASFLWIGTNAVAPNYTGGRSTATVDDGDPHGMQARSTQVSLTANTYYPFRVQFGEAGGGYESVITVTRPDGTSFTDGTGYYFSQ